MKKKKIVALLPMKANSERVKGKNFRNLAGKPLFRWMLDTLLAVDEIDLIVINTDARDILYDNGLNDCERVLIRERRPDLCGDLVSMNLILKDDIEHVNADFYIMTHTTNPLLSAGTVTESLQKFQSASDSDSLFSVSKVQTRFYRENLEAVNHNPDDLIRTQDLEPWYEENSCLYIFSRTSFAKTGARIGQNPLMFVTPGLESVDIDMPDDWTMAEALALYQKK